MREVIYKNRCAASHAKRVISIEEITENKDFVTHVRKFFIYIVEQPMDIRKPVDPPEYFITKTCDTKHKSEKFWFRVKGAFYVIKNECFYKVHFCHTLKINLVPKHKASPEEVHHTKKMSK